jgi:hypothetical protein
MDNDIIEVMDSNGSDYVPVYVTATGDWQMAIGAAAKLRSAEIIIYDLSEDFGVCVYSDNPNVYSGRWWDEKVHKQRRWLGR